MPAKVFPKWKFKVGRVDCAVWENGEFFNTEFKVAFEKNGKWEETHSFSKLDLAAVSMAANYAAMLILAEEQKR